MPKVYIDDMFPYCPTSDFTCPYYDKYTDRCMMFKEENVLPFEECDNFFDEEEYYDDCDYECGFDPYMGCFTDDC